jgi:hypothetical protein
MTLHEAIAQLIELGEGDPLTIARKIEKNHDKHWLSAELLALAEDLMAEMARQELGRVRRSREVALRPGDMVSSAEMKLAKVWVPGFGYKPAAEVTPADAAAKVRWYQAASTALMRRAVWWADVLGMMKAEGAGTLGKLKAALPPLPDGDDLEPPMLPEST